MPTPGLSLVGFLDQVTALKYFQNICVPADPSDGAITAEWTAAKNQLGAPIPKAGFPEVLEIPSGHDAYLQQVAALPWVQQDLPGINWTFKLVEIDPLLAFQVHVDTARAAHLCDGLGPPIPMAELLSRCLPTTLVPPTQQTVVQPGSLMIKSPSLNLRIILPGIFGHPTDGIAGVVVRTSLPLVQVVSFNGRCYLRNGFHRTYQLRAHGATHVPCIFWSVADFSGVTADGLFPQTLLESTDPPTLGHFARGSAYPVHLKKSTRVITVTWAEFGIPDE